MYPTLTKQSVQNGRFPPRCSEVRASRPSCPGGSDARGAGEPSWFEPPRGSPAACVGLPKPLSRASHGRRMTVGAAGSPRSAFFDNSCLYGAGQVRPAQCQNRTLLALPKGARFHAPNGSPGASSPPGASDARQRALGPALNQSIFLPPFSCLPR
jgi:hypothetical protein